MATRIHLSDLQLEHPEYRVMASTVARTLQENGFALIQLAQVDTEKLETLQAILKEKAVDWSTGADEAVLQPSNSCRAETSTSTVSARRCWICRCRCRRPHLRCTDLDKSTLNPFGLSVLTCLCCAGIWRTEQCSQSHIDSPDKVSVPGNKINCFRQHSG